MAGGERDGQEEMGADEHCDGGGVCGGGGGGVLHRDESGVVDAGFGDCGVHHECVRVCAVGEARTAGVEEGGGGPPPCLKKGS